MKTATIAALSLLLLDGGRTFAQESPSPGPQAQVAPQPVSPPTAPPDLQPAAPPAQPPARAQDDAGEADSQQPEAPHGAGQWVFTEQYGWVWMPYSDAYTRVPSDGYGEPYMYVYGPDLGWSWLVAPWVWGLGPWPVFGIYGAAHFGWYAHGWWRTPERWHWTGGSFSDGFRHGYGRGGGTRDVQGTRSPSFHGAMPGRGGPSFRGGASSVGGGVRPGGAVNRGGFGGGFTGRGGGSGGGFAGHGGGFAGRGGLFGGGGFAGKGRASSSGSAHGFGGGSAGGHAHWGRR